MSEKTETGNSLKGLKLRNRKLVLSYMRGRETPVSVNEISRVTGLSKMTVHKILDHYLRSGMVTVTGKGASTEEGGKKPTLFSFNPDCRYIYAVRFDGGRMSTMLVNLKGRQLSDRVWHSLSGRTFRESMSALGEAFAVQTAAHRLAPENCLAAVGGCSGPVTVRDDGEEGSFLWEWRRRIEDGMKASLPHHIFVHVDSWWRHMALEMLSRPELEGRRTFFLLGNSGDCVSGGLVMNGHILRGETGVAGEAGHIVTDSAGGRKCRCGGTGCLETFAAPGILAGHIRETAVLLPELAVKDGKDNLIASLTAAADRGSPAAEEILGRAVRHIALAVSNIISICDPGLVVLFGDYARAGDSVMARLRREIESLRLPGSEGTTKIQATALDVESGILGAARYITDIMFAGEQ